MSIQTFWTSIARWIKDVVTSPIVSDEEYNKRVWDSADDDDFDWLG